MSSRSRRSIYIDDAQWLALAELGAASDRSVANLVRQAVTVFLDGHRPGTPLAADIMAFLPTPTPGMKVAPVRTIGGTFNPAPKPVRKKR